MSKQLRMNQDDVKRCHTVNHKHCCLWKHSNENTVHCFSSVCAPASGSAASLIYHVWDDGNTCHWRVFKTGSCLEMSWCLALGRWHQMRTEQIPLVPVGHRSERDTWWQRAPWDRFKGTVSVKGVTWGDFHSGDVWLILLHWLVLNPQRNLWSSVWSWRIVFYLINKIISLLFDFFVLMLYCWHSYSMMLLEASIVFIIHFSMV